LDDDKGYQLTGLYGYFDSDMKPIDTIDVSAKVKQFINGDIIALPNTLNFNKIFGGIKEKGGSRYLQINAGQKNYNIAEDKYIHDVCINLNSQVNHIKIVYYLYINPDSNWQAIASGQLRQLKSYGILPEADLYIHVTDCHNLASAVSELLMEIVPSAIVSFSFENQYEYPGIKLIHDLALRYPDANFIYFHAKGMSHNLQERSAEEVALFTGTFQHWRKNLQYLKRNGIQKIGLFPGLLLDKVARPGDIGGWIWYNYWYATGSYLSRCPEPLIKKDKYYYEGWLALHEAEDTYVTNDSISLHKIAGVSKNYFSPVEADYHLRLIAEQLTSERGIRLKLKTPFIAHYYLIVRRYLSGLKRKLRTQ